MEDDPGNSVLTQLIIILILTLINAFFAASEMAMVSADKNKLKSMGDEGNKKAKKALQLLAEPSRFLSTIQVGITVAGFFNAASAAVGLQEKFGNVLASFGIPFAPKIAFALITIFLSYISLVFGELVPKRIALQNPERFSLLAINIVALIAKLTNPLIKFLSFSTNVSLRLLGINTRHLENKVTLEEIRSMVEVGQEQGVINPVEREMIDSVISFDDKQAEEIMTARTEVFMIDIDDPIEEYIPDILGLKYSRIPVYEDNPDNIIGILYLKDYMALAYKKGSFQNIKSIRGILRPAYFVPERKNINDLFNEMQDDRRHLSILIDEYGGVSGIVTMEDLIEEIMGDIDDEYDHDEPDIVAISDTIFRVNGSTSIKEFNSETHCELDEDSEDFDTIGGFLINLLDYIPDDGERPVIEFENLIFNILKVEDKRIKEVRIEILPIEQEIIDKSDND